MSTKPTQSTTVDTPEGADPLKAAVEAAGTTPKRSFSNATEHIVPGDPYPVTPETLAIVMRFVEDRFAGDMAKCQAFVMQRGFRGRPLSDAQKPNWTLTLQELARAHWADITAREPMTSVQVAAAGYYVACLTGQRQTADGREIDPMIVHGVSTLDHQIASALIAQFMGARTKGEYNHARTMLVAVAPEFEAKFRNVARQGIVQNNSFSEVDLAEALGAPGDQPAVY